MNLFFSWLRALFRPMPGGPSMPSDLQKIDFQLLMENSSDVVFQIGADRYVSYVSPSVLPVLGWRPEEMLGRKVGIIYEEDLHLIVESEKRLSTKDVQTDKQAYRAVKKDGSLLWVEGNARRIREPGTRGLGDLVVVLRDINDRILLEQKLEEQALTDTLTGLANRRSLDETLDREWRRTQREDTHLSLLLLDLDHFKSLNDDYGHQVGDDCLRAVAAAVKGVVRRPGDLAARYGGEEIAVILPNTDAQGAFEVAEAIRGAVEALRLPNAGNLEGGGWITISIGVATAFSRIGGSIKMPEGILLSADSALYKAKHGGRNRVAAAMLLMAKNEIGTAPCTPMTK